MGKSKKKGQLNMLDFIIAFILTVALGLALNPWLLISDVFYIWAIFIIALILIIAGIALTATKRYVQIALFAFTIGVVWFILTTLLLCSYVTTPLIA